MPVEFLLNDADSFRTLKSSGVKADTLKEDKDHPAVMAAMKAKIGQGWPKVPPELYIADTFIEQGGKLVPSPVITALTPNRILISTEFVKLLTKEELEAIVPAVMEDKLRVDKGEELNLLGRGVGLIGGSTLGVMLIGSKGVKDGEEIPRRRALFQIAGVGAGIVAAHQLASLNEKVQNQMAELRNLDDAALGNNVLASAVKKYAGWYADRQKQRVQERG